MKSYNDLKDSNQLAHYWELEEPEVITTDTNVIRYYPNAKRLVVHISDYFDTRVREVRPGKGVGLQLEALARQPDDVRRLIKILQSLLPKNKK